MLQHRAQLGWFGTGPEVGYGRDGSETAAVWFGPLQRQELGQRPELDPGPGHGPAGRLAPPTQLHRPGEGATLPAGLPTEPPVAARKWRGSPVRLSAAPFTPSFPLPPSPPLTSSFPAPLPTARPLSLSSPSPFARPSSASPPHFPPPSPHSWQPLDVAPGWQEPAAPLPAAHGARWGAVPTLQSCCHLAVLAGAQRRAARAAASSEPFKAKQQELSRLA